MLKKITLCFLTLLLIKTPTHSSPKTTQTLVNTNNAKLFCQVMGEGKPLIIVHGGPGLSQEYLLPQMSALAKDHLVIFYDQRGSGRSEDDGNPVSINMNTFVEDLEALRKHFGFKKFSILGHSWGGFLAMEYALSHPESIDKLILLNSVPVSSEGFGLFIKEWLQRMAPYMQELNKIENSDAFLAGDSEVVAHYLRVIFRSYCASPTKANELNLTTSTQANLNWIKTQAIFQKTLFSSSFDIYGDLKRLPCKTLIIHGDHDPIPLSTAQNLHKSIPNSQLEVIKDCGHFPYIEQPQELFALLNQFLSSKEKMK